MAFGTEITLVSSRTDTANVTASDGTAYTTADQYRRGAFILSVTAITSVTLSVAIQSYINGFWTDIARFADVTTVSTRVLWDVGGTVNTSTTTEEATQDLAITAGSKRAGPMGAQIRPTWTIASAGTVTWSCVGFLQA